MIYCLEAVGAVEGYSIAEKVQSIYFCKCIFRVEKQKKTSYSKVIASTVIGRGEFIKSLFERHIKASKIQKIKTTRKTVGFFIFLKI